jgi:hypothetical protein
MQNVVSDSFDVTTLLGSKLGLSLLLPLSMDTGAEFTLNKLFTVFPNESLNGETPKLKYFGVGIRGCYNADDGILQSAYNPKRTDMNLYSLIPIRCRPVDEDLSAAERSLYRIRVERTINNEQYWCYYLKVLNYTSNEVKFKRVNISTGREEAYELDSSYLNPVPERPSTDTTIETSANSVIAYAEATVELAASEILEYIRLNYNGDTRYAKISELGFFTGVDVEVTNRGVTYLESIHTQLYNHVTWLGANLTREGMTFESTFQINSNGSISDQ